MVHQHGLALASEIVDSLGRIRSVEALDKRRHKAVNRWMSYHKQNSSYNRKVRPWTITFGDLVLRATGHIKKGLSAWKFAPE